MLITQQTPWNTVLLGKVIAAQLSRISPPLRDFLMAEPFYVVNNEGLY
jgi:hypothetical protein